jgi:hypothetical protein
MLKLANKKNTKRTVFVLYFAYIEIFGLWPLRLAWLKCKVRVKMTVVSLLLLASLLWLASYYRWSPCYSQPLYFSKRPYFCEYTWFPTVSRAKFIYSIPRVPQCLSPRRNWNLPHHTLFRKRVCTPPLNQRRGDRLACRWGGGESQFGRLEKTPSTLSNLWFLTFLKLFALQLGGVPTLLLVLQLTKTEQRTYCTYLQA